MTFGEQDYSDYFKEIMTKVVVIFIWLTIFFILVLILNEIFGWYSIEISQLIPAGLGAIGPLLLAWVTVRTLEQNKDLVRNQKAQIKPTLQRVGRYSADDDEIKIELENVGYGKAIRIRMVPELYVRNFSKDPHPTLNEYITENHDDLPAVVSSSNTLYKTEKDIDIFTGDGGVLESGDHEEFSMRIHYTNTNIDKYNLDEDDSEFPRLLVFHKLVEYLKGEGIDELGFQFILKYEDILGNEYEESIPGPLFDVEEIETLSEALTNHFWVMDLDRNVTNKRENDGIKKYFPF